MPQKQCLRKSGDWDGEKLKLLTGKPKHCVAKTNRHTCLHQNVSVCMESCKPTAEKSPKLVWNTSKEINSSAELGKRTEVACL